MDFSSKADMNVPIEQAFEMLSDFSRHERSAMRRGAEVTRKDDLKQPGVGAEWDIRFDFRGKTRDLNLEVVGFDSPNEIALHGETQGLETDMQVELVALSRTRTRMNLRSQLKPKTLAARLLLQSVKLAGGNVTKRLDNRVAQYAGDLEERYARMA